MAHIAVLKTLLFPEKTPVTLIIIDLRILTSTFVADLGRRSGECHHSGDRMGYSEKNTELVRNGSQVFQIV